MHVFLFGHADNVLHEFTRRTAEKAAADAAVHDDLPRPDRPPAGTYWYHPHLHGAIAEQVVGGMAR
ncbi:hypothetical protein ACIGXM_29660 [Kitasatospora sp. NPDC052896]|uniref:hypothetical protein n=1 Tax=Kitasatospora sp. NPDC052896 TaxID=3364061 RepID=UPI0037CA3A04